VQVPWNKLSSQPCELELSDVNLLIEKSADAEVVKAWSRAVKRKRVAALDALHMQQQEGETNPGDDSMAQRMAWMIFNNLQARVPFMFLLLLKVSQE
jgi:hypothetical protein